MTRTRERQFPVTLFHKDNGTPEFAADPRHSRYTTYPIVVPDQEAFDRLGPGWCEDPVSAAEWTPDVVDEPAVLGAGTSAMPSEDPIDAANDLLDGTVGEVTERIDAVTVIESLTLLAEVETAGKNRKGVQTAITDRIDALNAGS
jgi:hypothetical protein